MNFVELIERKRDGGALSADEIGWLIAEYTADRIPNYQMSAMLMAVLLVGLDPDELAAWTEAMLHSGEILDFSDIGAPVIDLIPSVKVGFAGVQRNEETAEPIEYYFKPPDLAEATVLILEPMLATGGSLSWAVTKAKESGARAITCLCVVVAPAGVARMEREHPDVRIVAASLDRDLSDHFYIRPGLGDMGDRLFGTT